MSPQIWCWKNNLNRNANLGEDSSASTKRFLDRKKIQSLTWLKNLWFLFVYSGVFDIIRTNILVTTFCMHAHTHTHQNIQLWCKSVGVIWRWFFAYRYSIFASYSFWLRYKGSFFGKIYHFLLIAGIFVVDALTSSAVCCITPILWCLTEQGSGGRVHHT